MSKTSVLILIIIVAVIWIAAVLVWRASKARLTAWRAIIKKGDHAYFISEYGDKAFVTVLAVDRSRPRDIQVGIGRGADMSFIQWVEASELYPVPKPTEDN